MTVQSRREKYVITRECELARGSPYRKAHLRTRGGDRYGDNAKEHADSQPFSRPLYNAMIGGAISALPDNAAENGWSMVKHSGRSLIFFLLHNILEEITPAQDKAIASRAAHLCVS